jgi:PAS domain S-box-containing protein
VRATIETALAEKRTFTMRERIVRPDGSVRMLHSWGCVTLSPDGDAVGMMGTCLDMTQFVETREALRQSEEWLSRALEGTRMGLWDWDIATNRVRWSQGVASLFGLSPASFPETYEAYLECVHPDDRARVVETIRRSVEGGEDYEVEHRALLDDRSTRWLVCRGHVARDEAGKLARVAGSVIDVTQRHLVEEERRLFALIVERASDFIALASIDGRVLYVNEAGRRMVGLGSLAEARAKRVGEFLTPEGLKQSLEVELAAVLAHGHWEGEGQIVHFGTGKRIDVLTTSFLVVDPTTTEPRCLATIRRDVTARRALEEQLRQSQKMEVVGRLSAGIAHDFNNLLTVILGMAGVTLARGVADARTRAAIEDIAAAGQRAADLTKQLTAFGRRQLLHPQVVDLNEVVGEATKLLRRVLPVAINLDLSLSAEVVPAHVDHVQLEQVILNLAVNARDAMPDGGTLTIATRTEGRQVVLAVRDTGTGMTAEVRERAFEPFFTTKPEGKGTGLGLSMVYGIIHQSGGEVTLESEPGRGTVFEIRFPRAAEPVALPARPVAPDSGASAGTILVVDDNEAVVATVRRILEEEGYRVLDTSLPENALRLFMAHAGAIDVILSDIRMPKMDGYELVRRCREISPGARVLFMSGDAAAAGTDTELSRDSILPKPFMREQLVARVRELLAAS